MIRLSIVSALLLLSTMPAAARQRAAAHQSPCTLTVSPRNIAVPAAGGTIALSIVASGNCAVSPALTAAWISGSVLISPGGSTAYTVLPNTEPTPRVTTIDVGGVIVTVTQAAAEVQNLLVNPTFDRDLTGWFTTFSTGQGSATWSPLDANGATTSGSAQIRSTQGAAGYQLLECVNVLPNRAYEYGLKARIAKGQDAAGRLILGVYEYDVANCDKVGYGDAYQNNLNPPLDAWTPYSFTYVSSGSAKSVYFVVAAGYHRTPPFTIQFDDAFLRERK